MKKLIGTLLATTCLTCSLFGCASQDNEAQTTTGEETTPTEETTETEPVYVDESEIPLVFSNPEAYIDQHVVLEGKVSNYVGQDDGIDIYQAHYSFDRTDNVFMLAVEAGTEIETDDYIVVDGIILGTYEGTNAFGSTISNLAIVATDIEVLSYMDAVVPTVSEIIPEGASLDQNGVTISVDKIEFAEKETRVYITEQNNSGETFNLYSFNAVILQDGQQIEPDSSSMSRYNGDYPEVSSDLRSGATSSGVIIFPAMDSSIDFTFEIEGHSDDFHMDFEPYRFDIAGAVE